MEKSEELFQAKKFKCFGCSLKTAEIPNVPNGEKTDNFSVLEPVMYIKVKCSCACRKWIYIYRAPTIRRLLFYCLSPTLFRCKSWETLHGWESRQIYHLLHFQLIQNFQEKVLMSLDQLKIFRNQSIKPFLYSSEQVSSSHIRKLKSYDLNIIKLPLCFFSHLSYFFQF